MAIILHVGAGKCGSSSLQAHMSNNPRFSADDASTHYEYVCVQRNGDLLQGERIQLHTRMTPYGCQVSAGAEWPWAMDDAALKTLSTKLHQVIAQGRTPVASQESWFGEARHFAANNTLPRLGLRAKVVVFVRPQVAWLNSSWWQWGAWSSLDFRNWVEGTRQNVRWTQNIAAWEAVPGVDSVEVHLVGQDVVAEFLGSLGVTIDSSKRRNVSLDSNVLNYLRRRTDLRSLHNPVVDFVLEQRLAPAATGTPWVMQPDQISALIEYYREDNLKLLSLLPRDTRTVMENDPHWWDPAAYGERKAVPADLPEPTVEALDNVCARAIDAVIQLDGRVRTLEQSQRELIRASAAAKRAMLLATQEAECREPAPQKAVKRKARAIMLRKAISINGIRRLVGAKRAGSSAVQ